MNPPPFIHQIKGKRGACTANNHINGTVPLAYDESNSKPQRAFK